MYLCIDDIKEKEMPSRMSCSYIVCHDLFPTYTYSPDSP
jgi:hypothetical protein